MITEIMFSSLKQTSSPSVSSSAPCIASAALFRPLQAWNLIQFFGKHSSKIQWHIKILNMYHTQRFTVARLIGKFINKTIGFLWFSSEPWLSVIVASSISSWIRFPLRSGSGLYNCIHFKKSYPTPPQKITEKKNHLASCSMAFSASSCLSAADNINVSWGRNIHLLNNDLSLPSPLFPT